jgi:hypothetical protein
MLLGSSETISTRGSGEGSPWPGERLRRQRKQLKNFKSAGMAFDKNGPETRNRAKVPLQCAASRFRRRTRTMSLSIALSQRSLRHALQHWPHAHVVGQDEKQLTERIRVRLRSACLVIP